VEGYTESRWICVPYENTASHEFSSLLECVTSARTQQTAQYQRRGQRRASRAKLHYKHMTYHSAQAIDLKQAELYDYNVAIWANPNSAISTASGRWHRIPMCIQNELLILKHSCQTPEMILNVFFITTVYDG